MKLIKLGRIASVAMVVLFACGFAVGVRAQTYTAPPSIPTGLATSIAAPSQITVTWGASTGGSGSISYYVYRNGQAINSTSGTSFTESNLPPGVYSYAVAAYDSSGDVSARSAPVSATLLADTVAPSAPTKLVVSPTKAYVSQSSTSVSLSWAASTDNIGVVGYYVYRDNVKITVGTSSAVTGTSYTDTLPVGPDWTYTYTVEAYDATGNISAPSAPASILVIYNTTPPSAPQQFSGTQMGLTSVALSWATSTATIPVEGYYIYRNGTQITAVSSSPYTDTGLSAGSSYGYVLKAYDAAGNISPPSTQVNVSILGDTQPPSIPINVVAKVNASSIALSWAPSADTISVAGYVIYRNGAQIANVSTTAYVDSTPAAGANLYNLYSYNLGGVSSTLSNTASVSWYPGMVTTTTAPVAVSTVTPAPVAVVTTPASAPVVTAPASPVVISSPVAMSAGQSLTTTLYYGLRNAQVSALQTLLSARGYLSSSITGFFGNLTLQALEKFQCDNSIACSGAPGYGVVGPKTRAALNGSAASSTAATSAASQLQMLEDELKALQSQAQ